MKKDIRSLVILFAILLLLVTTFFVLRSYEPVSRAPAEPPSIIDIHVSTIQGVAIKGPTDRYGIISFEGILMLEPNKQEIEYSLKKMQSFLYILSKLEGLKEIPYKVEHAEQFGFNNPSGEITILRDGGKIELTLGRANEWGYYLLNESESRAFVVSSAVGDLFRADRSEFLDLKMLPTISSESMDKLESISLWRASDPTRSYRIEGRGDFTFLITEPIESTLDFSRLFSDLILPISSLTKSGKLSNDSVPSEEPVYTLNLEFDGTTYGISVFEDQGAFYIQYNGTSYIWSVPTETVAFLETNYMDLLGGTVYHGNMGQVASIELYKAGESVGLLDNQENEESSGFLRIYTDLLAIPVRRELAVDRPGDPLYRIRVVMNQGRSDMLEFFPIDGFTGYLGVNGKINFVVPSTYVEQLYNSLEPNT